MYGGRVSYTDPELFWDGGNPDQYDLRLDTVDVGQGSSGSPIVNMAGEMVAVLSGSLADLSAPRPCRHLDGEWGESVVSWEHGLLDAATHSLTMGPHVDLAREFVELRSLECWPPSPIDQLAAERIFPTEGKSGQSSARPVRTITSGQGL